MFAAFSKLTQNYVGRAETVEALAAMILSEPAYYGAIDGYEALDIGDTNKDLDYVPLYKARQINKTVAWPAAADDDKIAVLDDCTKDAHIIGFAATEAGAADVFMAYMRERMDADDFASLQRPTFAWRRETSIASPAFEPLW